jgi:putative sterol carrier protein
MSDAYFSLPRTTRAGDWFEKILPSLGLRLPAAAETPWTAVHVHGVGGGTWSLRVHAGKLEVVRGAVAGVWLQWSMTTGHFREALAGALRDRSAAALQKLGLPLAIPDLSRAQLDRLNWQKLQGLKGSIAFALADRKMADTYRYVLTLGPGAAALDTPDAQIDADLDDLLALAVARTPPLKLLASGKLRVAGKTELPMQALTALLASAAGS